MTAFHAPTAARLENLIASGYGLVKNHRYLGTGDVWLEAWAVLKVLLPPHITSIENATLALSRKFILSSWCQDMQEALGRAGLENKKYFRKRVSFIKDFCRRLPETSRIVMMNMKLAEAETYCVQGRSDLADKVYDAIRSDFPGFHAA